MQQKRGECHSLVSSDESRKKGEISAISIHVFARKKKNVLSLQVRAKKNTAVGTDNNDTTSESFMSVLHANRDHESRKSCHKTSQIRCHRAKNAGPDFFFPNGLKQPLNFSPKSASTISSLRMLSVISAWRINESSTHISTSLRKTLSRLAE